MATTESDSPTFKARLGNATTETANTLKDAYVSAGTTQAAAAGVQGLITLAEMALGTAYPQILATPLGQEVLRVALPTLLLFMCQSAPELPGADQVSTLCTAAIDGNAQRTAIDLRTRVLEPLLQAFIALGNGERPEVLLPVLKQKLALPLSREDKIRDLEQQLADLRVLAI